MPESHTYHENDENGRQRTYREVEHNGEVYVYEVNLEHELMHYEGDDRPPSSVRRHVRDEYGEDVHAESEQAASSNESNENSADQDADPA